MSPSAAEKRQATLAKLREQRDRGEQVEGAEQTDAAAEKAREARLAQRAALSPEAEAEYERAHDESSAALARAAAIREGRVSTEAPRTERVDRVRKTIDLWPADNRKVQAWLGDAADEMGEARVTWQDAAEGLVWLMLNDPSTSRRLIAHLRVRGQK